MRFTLFKLPEHRTFNYQPVFYDERKEALQKKIDAAEKAKMGEYVPGSSIRGSFKKNREAARKGTRYTPLLRFLSITAIVIILVGIMYIAQMMGLLL